jgi:hypothetical protein
MLASMVSCSVGVRWMVAAVAWALVSTVAMDEPVLLFAWPLNAAAVLCVLIGALSGLGPAYRRTSALAMRASELRWLRAGLLALVAVSVTGIVGSRTPAMAWRSKSGIIQYSFSLSHFIAPALWSALAVLAVAAAHRPSLRRLASLIIAGVVAWPFLLAIRALRVPLFDIDDQYVELAPWALDLYSASVALVAGLAIALNLVVRSLAARPPVAPPPPRAALVS